MTHTTSPGNSGNLCDALRDDGINHSDYVTELLLFVKMEYEQVHNSA